MIELPNCVTFLFSFWGALWVYELCFLILHITQRCSEAVKYFYSTLFSLSSLWCRQLLKFCIFVLVTISWILQLFGILLEDCGVDFLFKFYSAFGNKRAWMHNIFWLCLAGHTASMASWILTFIFKRVFFSLSKESMTLLQLTAIGDHFMFISEMKPFNVEIRRAGEFGMRE